ncbi:MAG: NADH-quinone oxidoreductase subunit M [SAR202 cluster bacterium]|jgi:NADH-quinone oxidoreductase subunit M|nr:NADH-quinone oxidoreductase subunit M [SAR202 cluster bacterium]MQG69865.1 NADH-quinone oxidoreductase subunit M [SAR202 cluster bacterium]HAL48457.1 NADH-quinone oxidoreductase subunit M [Dehalococcoidia bacterium]
METFDSYALFLLIVIPLAGAAVIMLVPSRMARAIRWAATVAAAANLLLSFYVVAAYDFEEGGFQFQRAWDWIQIPGPWSHGDKAITLNLGMDGIAAPMVLLTGIVLFTGVLISWRIANRNKDFFILYLLLLSGVFGVFVSVDMFFFFFFYELAVLPMYLLIGVWGSSSTFPTFSRTKEYSAMKLMLYLVAGSVLVWIAIMAIFVEAGLGTFNLMELQNVTLDNDFQRVFFPFLMVGFGVLAGLWPFHTWSPDGHVAAPTAVSMVHAGVLMKLGAFGIIRVGMLLMPEGAQDWMPVLIGLGTVNVLCGAWSAMGQTDLKYVIGYSSVSHMGYVMMGLATLHSLGVAGAVLQMLSHGLMTALFFAVVGVVYDRTHTRDMTVLDGLAKRMGFTAVLFALAGLASLGLPGLSGFVAELLVFLGLFHTFPVLGVLGIIGAGITAVYILRLLARVFFGPIGEQWKDQTDASGVERIGAIVLAGFILLVGLFPFPFIRVINSGVMELLARFEGIG